ncbi:hypothetical protein HYFRA_00003265 [Hymenoscyphus fraxineus]|uniref:Uncharacterized protein n=1 Tax=Hymenoscyphus fraxineus TaxID=746836 RepID=A0A9N9KVV7_9HELO|nr:hypothetical protein HYFRA_00003265 [Hymenoscyphus fraxineus]
MGTLILAITHLLFFQFLDGREVDGPRNVASQSIVVTVSNGLAIAFGITLRTSLAIAFCQHLWRLLRQSAMKVSLIEDLFTMRSNPFLLLKLTVLKATPSLVLLVILMLASQVATAFPPGAINVVSTQRSSIELVPITSFNASFMGNGSGVAAQANSFVNIDPSPENGGYIPSFEGFTVTSSNILSRLARQVLSSGESLPMASPCGVNCTYHQVFEGPFMECSTTSTNVTWRGLAITNDDPLLAYSGKWTSGTEIVGGNPLHKKLYNGTYSLATFNSTTHEPISVVAFFETDKYEGEAVVQQDNTTCTPGRALYTVNNTYENNVLRTTYTTQPLERLVNLNIPTHEHVVLVPGINMPLSAYLGIEPANWTSSALAIYRDTNHMAIHGALLSWLNGNYTGLLPTNDTHGTHLRDVARVSEEEHLYWIETIDNIEGGITYALGESTAGQIMSASRLNKNFDQLYSNGGTSGPLFKITQDVFNDYLFKITTSAMQAYGRWNTTTNATVFENINVYTFSQPLNLVLPYFITLFVSIPFIILGSYALILNGVSATDGGFVQILATTTGSAALDDAAAGGCLGGDENVAQRLKDLKIRYGELVGRRPGNVKLAGFGIDNEVIPLTKGEKYGIARYRHCVGVDSGKPYFNGPISSEFAQQYLSEATKKPSKSHFVSFMARSQFEAGRGFVKS